MVIKNNWQAQRRPVARWADGITQHCRNNLDKGNSESDGMAQANGAYTHYWKI